MRRTVPSLDQIARALLVHGARDAAVDLMEAVVARGGEERPRCEALLVAVRARPNDRVSGPPIALDAGLVEALAAQGRLVEAWAVTRGARVGHTVAGVEIAQALSLVMDPGGLEEPWLTRWTGIVAAGNAAEISSIEREVIAGKPVPPILLERMRIAWRLLKGFWSAAANEAPTVGLDPILRSHVGLQIQARDLPGALATLRAAAETSNVVLPVAMALARLLSAAERAQAEEGPGVASTMPLEGSSLALLQLRMGNFEDAERLLRKVVVGSPSDHVARDRLADVLVLRRALEGAATEEPEPLELAKTPAPDWLNKKVQRVTVEGWAASPQKGAPKAPPPSWNDDSEPSTSVIRPDEEAELHVKAGHPERAIPIYELLAQRYADKPRFKARLAEIRAMVEAAKSPKPAAMGLAAMARTAPAPTAGNGTSTAAAAAKAAPLGPAPTASAPAATDHPEDFDDEPTTVERWGAPPPPPQPLAAAKPPAPQPAIAAKPPGAAKPASTEAPIAAPAQQLALVPVRPIVRIR